MPFTLAAVAFGMTAPATAPAASFPKGTVTLTLDPGFRKLVDLRLAGGKDGKFSNRSGTATLPLDATGSGSLKTLTATAQSRTRWRLQAGSRRIRFSGVRLVVRRAKPALDAVVVEQRNRRVKLFAPTGKRRAKAGGGFTRLSAKKTQLVLTKAGAAALNSALKTTAFKKGAKAGTLTFTLDRALSATGGEITLLFDAGIADAVEACEGILPQLAPGTREVAQNDVTAPKGGFVAPARAQSVFTPRTGALTLATTGGFDLIRTEAPLGRVSFTAFTVTRRTIEGAAGRIADLTGGTPRATFTATGGTVSLTGAVATAATPLSQAFTNQLSCALPAGTRIGTVTATATGP